MILTVSAKPNGQEWVDRLNRKRLCLVLFRDAQSFEARVSGLKRYRCGRKNLLEREVRAHGEEMALRSKMYKKHQRKRTNGSSKASSRSRHHYD